MTAVVIQNPDGPEGGHGVLVLGRTSKKLATTLSGSIGPSCLRTLHPLAFATAGTEIAIAERATIISIPLPKLRDALKSLASPAKPAKTYGIGLSGPCGGVRATPSFGPREGFVLASTQPYNAIGQAWSEPGNNTCTISGRGKVTLTSVGPVVTTALRLPSRPKP